MSNQTAAGWGANGVKLNSEPITSRLVYDPGELLDCVLDHYSDGQVALLLYDALTGEPVAKATVCLETFTPPDGCVALKVWGENVGVEETLLRAGIILPGVQATISCGFAEAHVYRLARSV